MFGAWAGELALYIAEERVGGNDIDHIGFLNGVARLDIVLYDIVNRAVFAGVGTHAEGKVALRIEINAEDFKALVLETGADRVR